MTDTRPPGIGPMFPKDLEALDEEESEDKPETVEAVPIKAEK